MEFLSSTSRSRRLGVVIRDQHHSIAANGSITVKSVLDVGSSSLRRETSILEDLQGCSQIVRCLGAEIYTDNYGEQIYDLFLQRPDGSLPDLVSPSGFRFYEPHIKFFTRSILIGLRYIHQKNYVHRNINPHNLLVTKCRGVLIAGFEHARKSGESGISYSHETLRYAAPESVVRGEYEAPVDIWSLGCVVAEMAFRRSAWSSSTEEPLLTRIGFTDELPGIPDELSDDGMDFLRRCFVRDPKRRWTAEKLLHHPFVTGAEVLINPPWPISKYDPLDSRMSPAPFVPSTSTAANTDLKWAETMRLRIGGRRPTSLQQTSARIIWC